jgi:GT2 family glycosyltransferase
MSATPISHPPSSILAVVVLYNCEPSQSQSVSSLLQILNEDPALAQHFSLILYDNSPQPQSLAIQAGFSISYLHDPGNGGLAPAYNFALQRAEADEYKWLLLLDQDTSPTREFLLELLETVGNLDTLSGVAAIVPKLLVNGEVHSPAASFIDQLRRQFLPPPQAMKQDVVGVQQQHLCAYNSGSTLRVSALRSIGGFPAEFWLDFLDHAVFHALFVSGFRMYVMQTALAHDFSHTEIETVPAWRLHNVLLARTLYLEQRGNFIDRLLYRIWLLRHARKLRQSGKDLPIWKETALQALRLKLPQGPGSSSPLGADRPSAALRGDGEER